MNISIVADKVTFNSDGFKRDVGNFFKEKAKDLEDAVIRIMQEEEKKTNPGARGGSSHIKGWREKVAAAIKVIEESLSIDSLNVTIGIEDDGGEIYRKAAIIAMGGGPTMWGPAGRTVWDSDYAGQVTSQVKNARPAPASWTLAGNQWYENSLKRIETYFKDWCASIEIPIELVTQNIVIG